MAEERWLGDQPKTGREVKRALRDIFLLLEHLGELPDARLAAFFRDTHAGNAGGAFPPCDTYADFLERLVRIRTAFETGRAESLPADVKGRDGTTTLGVVGFVYWSRDFLAAVAAPATADSVRLTRDYITCRSNLRPARWFSRLLRRPPRPREGTPPTLAGRPPPPPAAPSALVDSRNAEGRQLAGRMARRVRNCEVATVVAVLLAMVVSIYALSGRLILANQQETEDAWSKVDELIEQQEEKLFKSTTFPLAEGQHLSVPSLCDATETVFTDKPYLVAERADPNAGAPVDPAAPSAVRTKRFASPRQEHLCEARGKTLHDLFVVTVHLQSWNSVIAERLPGLSYAFGIAPRTLDVFAGEGGGTDCFKLRDEGNATQAQPSDCRRVLWDEIDRSRNVANSVLGAITQYILPVLYGFLGAMAANFRLLRRKVDGATLSYTDRPRMLHGAILGVLSGAVIGLFASYMGKTDAAGGLGISGFALLAGYNVDGVFRFLDELSDRLFRPATPVAPAGSTRPG